jgi:putative hydrolase of the HAD superfamily
MRTLKALVFDFDGLIADTETLDWEVWAEEWERHGLELPMDDWLKGIGAGPGEWSPTVRLEAALGRPFDKEAAAMRTRDRLMEKCLTLTPRPGIEAWIQELKNLSIPYGIASSSDSQWVLGILEMIGLRQDFEVIVTRDQVARAKPFPDLYLEACRRLEVDPSQAAAFEDSLNGITAALTAGLLAVAIPGPITQSLDFGIAHLRVSSPTEMSWSSLTEAASRSS